jgi:hypothetical protein
MGLGPFQKELEQKLGKLSKDELSRILLAHGKTIASSERRTFLSLFDAAPPVAVRKGDADDDKTLVEDIREFIADLKSGKYFEYSGFDEETRDYRSYGDESWVDEMDDLFGRAGDMFLHGKREIAAEAYGLLLHAFDLGEEDGCFCGATSAEEMVATDITEAKARYLRAIYETTPPKERPAKILREMNALRYRGDGDMGIEAVMEADAIPMPGRDAFMPAWIKLLKEQDDDDAEWNLLETSRRLLREAVLMKDGVGGLAKLAGEHGAYDPKIFNDWLDALLKQGNKDEARDVARRAMNTVEQPAAKAVFAEQWATLTDNAADRLEAARFAWRNDPTVARLLMLNSVNSPSSAESAQRMTEEVRHWRTGKMMLDDRKASVLLILSGEYEDAVDLMVESKPQVWNHGDDANSVVYPFVLLAVVMGKDIPKGSVLSLWRHELTAADRFGDPFHETATKGSGQASGAGLWSAMQSVLEYKPLTDEQRQLFLEAAKKAMRARLKVIADERQRGAYDRGARMLVGWFEAAKLGGPSEEAQRILDQVMKDYSRLSALKKEINALLGTKEAECA